MSKGRIKKIRFQVLFTTIILFDTNLLINIECFHYFINSHGKAGNRQPEFYMGILSVALPWIMKGLSRLSISDRTILWILL